MKKDSKKVTKRESDKERGERREKSERGGEREKPTGTQKTRLNIIRFPLP